MMVVVMVEAIFSFSTHLTLPLLSAPPPPHCHTRPAAAAALPGNAGRDCAVRLCVCLWSAGLTHSTQRARLHVVAVCMPPVHVGRGCAMAVAQRRRYPAAMLEGQQGQLHGAARMEQTIRLHAPAHSAMHNWHRRFRPPDRVLGQPITRSLSMKHHPSRHGAPRS